MDAEMLSSTDRAENSSYRRNVQYELGWGLRKEYVTIVESLVGWKGTIKRHNVEVPSFQLGAEGRNLKIILGILPRSALCVLGRKEEKKSYRRQCNDGYKKQGVSTICGTRGREIDF